MKLKILLKKLLERRKSYFKLITGVVDNVSVAKQTSTTQTITLAVPDGYSIKNLFQVKISDATVSGSRASFSYCYGYALSGNTVSVNVRNQTDSYTLKIRIDVCALLEKN